jgi:ABC-type transport system substrate-binding protein
MNKRFWGSIAMAAVGTSLLIAAGFAAPAESGTQKAGKSSARGGTLRVESRSDFDYIDPSLSYFSHTFGQLHGATQLTLMGFPDKEGAAGARMRPEGAASYTVSRDGKTYTFRLRPGFRFSNGTMVTAANYIHSFNRVKNPAQQSPASQYLDDVASWRAINRNTIQFRLKVVAPDFISRLTMPFFAAIPTNLPIVAEGVDAPLVSAGPYYVREWNKGRSSTVVRNPHWNRNRQPWKALGRPANVDQIVYTFGNTPDAQLLKLRRNEADLGGVPPAAHSELAQEFGLNKSRYFIRKNIVLWYFGLNHDRPLFKGNNRLKQAVNHAIDRPQIVRQHGYLGGGRTDQILPPGMPGFREANIYSIRGANVSRAQALARGSTRDGKAVFYAYNVAPGPQIAQVVQFNLKQIGIDVEIKQFDRVVQNGKQGTRGEPFDIAHEGWGADYPDPSNFINVLLQGTRLQATNNNNTSYFNEAQWNRRMESAYRLGGANRLRTYGQLDIDMMRTAAPMAPYINTNNRSFVGQDVGCYTFAPVHGSVNLVAVCKK